MEYREKIEALRHRMNRGEITYEQAQTLASPIIAKINAKAAKIAYKFGKKPTVFTFRYLMR